MVKDSLDREKSQRRLEVEEEEEAINILISTKHHQVCDRIIHLSVVIHLDDSCWSLLCSGLDPACLDWTDCYLSMVTRRRSHLNYITIIIIHSQSPFCSGFHPAPLLLLLVSRTPHSSSSWHGHRISLYLVVLLLLLDGWLDGWMACRFISPPYL